MMVGFSQTGWTNGRVDFPRKAAVCQSSFGGGGQRAGLYSTRNGGLRSPRPLGGILTMTSRLNTVALVLIALLHVAPATAAEQDGKKGERHFLYVASPGIRNYLDFGGAGILV